MTDGPACGPNGCTPVSPEVRDVLIKARDILRQPGTWIQKSLYRDGGCCALGAIDSVAIGSIFNEDDKVGAAAVRLAESIPECWFDSYPRLIPLLRNVPGYNNAPGRTVEDILSLFDHAIEGKQMPSPE